MPISDADLEAYLDESLPPAAVAEIESALREDEALVERLRSTLGRRDAGVHSLGAIWRRHRLTCFSRRELGNYLLGVMSPAESAYATQHLEVIGCRICQANLEDLRRQQDEPGEEIPTRRRRYFQSSAGYLSRDE